jgi:SSS family solute:Na+ symporter
VIIAAANMLTLPDYVVISLYLIGTLAIGVAVGMRIKTGTDFFLGGRRLPWWAIGMSLVATDIGGTDIIGVGGAAYKHGLAVANFEWIGCVPAMIVGAFVFIPFFYRAGVYTVPEYLECRYNAAVRAVVAVCWLLFMACNMGIMLLASAKMMSAVFDWNEITCIIATAILVGGYTLVGGLAAVVYTDVIQCVVMIAGCLLILVLGLVEVGGVGELKARLAEADARQAAISSQDNEITALSDSSSTERTSLILPADTDSPFPWPGIFFGLALILSPAYWVGNQAIVQRSLGAKSEFEARASYIWGALLKSIVPLIVAVPGLIAVALLPDLKDGDAAIPSLVGVLLPAGLRGLFVAAFIAALMSSIDSYLNSAATIVSSDLYKRFYDRDVSDERLLTVGRITTVALVAWAIGFALLLTVMSEDSGIYAIFQTLMAFFQGPAFAILLIGILWRRATGRAALIALLCGIGTSISLYALNQPAVFGALGWEPLFKIEEPFLYFSIWAFTVTAVVLVVLSLLDGPPPAEKLKYVFGGHRSSSSSDTVDDQTETEGSTT